MSAHHAEEMIHLGRKIWGDQNASLSTREDIRFGSQGSKSIRRSTGEWFDHETGEGGGFASLFAKVHGEPPQNGTGNIAATYDYRDANGALVFQVVRKMPKDFRQRRPDGHGGWILISPECSASRTDCRSC